VGAETLIEKCGTSARERFAKFNLELHPDKTRLIEFGRYAARHRKARGLGKPETFTFVGFAHISGKRKSGAFWLRRITIAKRLQAKPKQVRAELMRRRHLPVPEHGRWLASVVRGHANYYAVPGNLDVVAQFRTQLTRAWFKALRRRSQRNRLNWERMGRLANRWLPPARNVHPFPEVRSRGALCRQDLRQEPSAGIPLAGICAGGGPKGPSLTRTTGPYRSDLGHRCNLGNRACK
jgi:hypothetical protein